MQTHSEGFHEKEKNGVCGLLFREVERVQLVCVGGEIEGSTTQMDRNRVFARRPRIGGDQRHKLVEEPLHLEGIADGIDLGQKGTLDSEALEPVTE